MPDLKRCTKCKLELLLSDFHINLQSHDGYCGVCKTCDGRRLGSGAGRGSSLKLPWSCEEDEVLISLYGESTMDEILSALPGRTRISVKGRVVKIGLHKSSDQRDGAHSLEQPVIAEIPEIEKSYLAGIVDGEGCFSVSQRQRLSKSGERYYSPAFCITNTSEVLKEWLLERMPFGGVYYPKKLGPNDRPRWQFSLSSRRTLVIAGELLPFLVMKKEQARLLAVEWSGATRARKEEIYWLFNELNRRGMTNLSKGRPSNQAKGLYGECPHERQRREAVT